MSAPGADPTIRGHRARSRRLAEQSGFTLVELLVVTVILALLAAVAIPSYFSQRDRAADNRATQQLQVSARALETYATDNGGGYENATVGKLINLEPTLGGSFLSLESPVGHRSFTVHVKSSTGGTFTMARISAGDITRSCDTPGSGACHADGTW